MRSLLLVILSLAILFSVCSACITQSGSPGKCINVKKCPTVMKLLRSNPPKRIYFSVWKDRCGLDGNESMICCEIPQSPHHHKRVMLEIVDDTPVDNHRNLHLLDHERCGPTSPELRIHGGIEARLFEFPWMALLAYKTGKLDGGTEFRCSGTIISKRYILTAAHCVSSSSDQFKLVKVRVGDHNIAEEFDCEPLSVTRYTTHICAVPFQEFAVEKVLPHPNYSAITHQNDIALVRLNSTINFRPKTTRPICLPLNSTSQPRSSSAIVSGWGATEKGSQSSGILLKVTLPLLPIEDCERSYKDQPHIKMSHKQICAGGKAKQDACTGDSGGPLQSLSMYKGKLRTIQHGIVSYGRRICAAQDSPGVYTNVRFYMGWILDNLEE